MENMDDSLIQYLSVTYGVSVISINQQEGISNDNYRIETNHDVFLLRIHSLNDKELSQLQFEVNLLAQISDDNYRNIKFQKPLRNKVDGSFISKYGTKYVTILTWINGGLLPTIDTASEKQLENIGKTVALLHTILENTFVDEVNHKVFNEMFFLEKLDFYKENISKTGLPEETSYTFVSKMESFIHDLKGAMNEKEHIHIIHGDLHSGNYIMNYDEVSLIDFGYIGEGTYYYDLAQALMEISPTKHHVFLEGYIKLLPHRKLDISLLNRFIGLAFLDNLSNLLAIPREYEFVESETKYALDFINQYCH